MTLSRVQPYSGAEPSRERLTSVPGRSSVKARPRAQPELRPDIFTDRKTAFSPWYVHLGWLGVKSNTITGKLEKIIELIRRRFDLSRGIIYPYRSHFKPKAAFAS